MCGIVGAVQYPSKLPRDIRHRALKILFSATMLNTLPRGSDATGIYQVHADGDWTMAKEGKKVTEWLYQERNDEKSPFVYRDFVDAWSEHQEELIAAVGHCRKATRGSRGKENKDNHPFAIQLDSKHAILGVHNGTLDNHEIIFDRLPKVLERQGVVDSEAIFHFLFHLTEHGTKPVEEEMLKHLARRLEGTYAVIMVNTRFPNQVVTFRRERPLEFFMISPLNVLLMTSEKKFAEEALAKYEFIRQMGLAGELPPLKFCDRSLADRDCRIFDTSREGFPSGEITPNYQDFNRISYGCELIKYIDKEILAEWSTKELTIDTSHSSPIHVSSKEKASNTKQPTSGAIIPYTPKISKKPVDTSKPDTTANSKAVAPTVKLDNNPDVKRALESAISLGLNLEYETTKDVASALGYGSGQEVSNLTLTELSNQVGALHFALGYALRISDAKVEHEADREKARGFHRKLETLAEKQTKAEQHIWELRVIIQIMLALAERGCSLSTKNILIVMNQYPDLDNARKDRIIATAGQVIDAEDTKKIVSDLKKRFRVDKKPAKTSVT